MIAYYLLRDFNVNKTAPNAPMANNSKMPGSGIATGTPAKAVSVKAINNRASSDLDKKVDFFILWAPIKFSGNSIIPDKV